MTARRPRPFRPNKPWLGPWLHRGVSYDSAAEDGRRFVISEEYVAGYRVLSRHPTAEAAMAALARLEGKP